MFYSFGRLAFCGVVATFWSVRADSLSATQSLSLALTGQIQIVSVPSSLTVTPLSTAFGGFGATMPITFRVRTSPSPGGTATVTLSAVGDFTPAGGPRVANGDLSYSCISSTVGNVCASSQAVLSSQTTAISIGPGVCTGGGNPCTTADPNTATIVFRLNDNPAFVANTYSLSLLVTGSAL